MFYDNGIAPMVSNVTLAALLQRYITHFAETWSHNGLGLPLFAMNEVRVAQNLDGTYIGLVQDEPLGGERCTY